MSETRCRQLSLASWMASAFCGSVLTISVALVVLPAAWVGRPYMDFVRLTHPQIDAPDHWAMACIYFITIASLSTLTSVVFAIVALTLHPVAAVDPALSVRQFSSGGAGPT